MQAGNLTLLNYFGRNSGDPAYSGDFTDLYRSVDLKKWEYVHRFYERNLSNCWTDESEDDMCPSFLPLPTSKEGGGASGKYLQLFISHNKGCQYYIGDYDRDNDRFLPETHGRMTWVDNAYFAPEAMLLPDGRQVMWAWINEKREQEWKRFGWSGIFGLPRTLWLREDGSLGIAPLQELKKLRLREYTSAEEIRSNHLELELEADPEASVELRVLVSEDGNHYVSVGYEPSSQELFVDTARCGEEGSHRRECAPLRVCDGRRLKLTVYVDASVVEVFANDRQAIARLCYPREKRENRVMLVKGRSVSLRGWELDYTNPY